MQSTGKHIARSGTDIAWISDGPSVEGSNRPGLFWLGGFKSDMTGTKAEMLAELCRSTSRNSFRFDYSGHGASGGDFRNGTISHWLDEAIEMFEQHAGGRRIVVGSSMGGWIALLLARHLAEANPDDARRIAGLVLIAPAADMTETLMWNTFDDTKRQTILRQGYYEEPSIYGPDPYTITRELIEDGRRHLILNSKLHAPFPVRILHGEDDRDVPWQHGKAIYDALSGPDVTFSLIKSGDHRLSTDRDLETLHQACIDLCQRAEKSV